jgi:outer membrane receptor protein involved in Fe transport
MVSVRTIRSVAVAIFLTSLIANAADSLEEILDETTKIATKTKLNVDYVPSVVSVLRGSEMRALGVQKVSDALSLIPGVQVFVNQFGQTTTVFRGFRNPNADKADKVKILVDGMAVGSEVSGSSSFVMDLPIELIERIEILRGPSSTVYGTGAFYGAVNIITKSANGSTGNELFIGGGSWYSKKIGGIFGTTKDGVSYQADGYYQGGQRKLSLDSTYVDGPATFPRERRTNEAFDDFSTGFTLKNDNLAWTTRIKKSWQGNYYGLEERLEPREDTGQINQLFVTEISHDKAFSNGILSSKIGVKDYAYRLNEAPRTKHWIVSNAASSGLVGMNEDATVEIKYAETTYYAEATYHFNKFLDNELSIGAGVTTTALRQNGFRSSVEDFVFANIATLDMTKSITNEPMFDVPQNNYYIKDGTRRTTGSFFIDDIYKLSDNSDIIIGARIDKHDDSDVQYNARVGVATRWFDDSSAVTKLIASTGSRAPTLIEKYAVTHYNEWAAGPASLKQEQIRSLDAMLIYRPDSTHRMSLNGYYSELSNVIDMENDPYTAIGFTNYPKRFSKGIEAEYTFTPNLSHKLSINASFNKTTYYSTSTFNTQSMPDISPIMYKAWYIYAPTNYLTFGIKHLHHSTTTQNQDYGTTVTSIPANISTDININWQVTAKTKLSFAVNNIADNTIRMPSYYYTNYLSKNGTAFNDGTVREGRNFFVTLRKSF